MTMSRMFCAAVLLLTVSSAPSLAGPNWPDSVDEYVAKVRATVTTTDMDGFLAVVRNPGNALLVDVRTAEEFKAGHVPGTVSASRGRLEFQIWKALGYPEKTDLNRKIYLQCGTGARAVLAAKQLKELGFTNVTAVVMNFADWQQKGHPVVKD